MDLNTITLYFKQIEVGPMANFVYFVGDKIKREVLIVDPAWQVDTLFKVIEKEDLEVVGVLITHSHFDHCNGIEELMRRMDVPIYVQREEIDFIKSLGKTNDLFGNFPEENLKYQGSGDHLKIGNVEITFLHTPGHTPGSQCFLVGDYLISGDTLFIQGCGRCDLPGSDPNQMYESLHKKLMKLPDETILFPGHNYSDRPSSKLSEEKKKNPYLICHSLETFLKMVRF